MSQKTDRNADQGDGGGVPQAMLRVFRDSMRRASGGKGAKVAAGQDVGSPSSPPSPDPNVVGFGDSLMRRGASIRRSLKLGSKKDKGLRPEALVSKGPGVDKMEEEEEQEEEEAYEEMEESYTLPEIPHTPLSVMQINKLIEMEVLEEAHLNLLALRREFQQEQERCSEDSPMELAKKEKDLNLLYGELRNKVNAIVRDSNSLPSRNKGLLVAVARIIQEEERRAEEPGGLAGSWMEAWREAVDDGVRAKVAGVQLERTEQNASWLAVHLGLLGKAVTEDLQQVRAELRRSYPPSFQVFGAYVGSYGRVVGQHVGKLEQRATELKDLHALLDWIINRYQSERIMGSPSLQPDMRDHTAQLKLEDDFLPRLRDKFCCAVKEDLKASFVRIITMEDEDFWKDGKPPEKEDDLLSHPMPMDIWTKVEGIVSNCRLIDDQLQQRVISSCLQELKDFPKRLEAEFRRRCDALRPARLWTEYQITYVNCFAALQQHMGRYRDACPQEVDAFGAEATGLTARLLQALEEQFKEEVEPYLRRMMTRKWLTNDDDFQRLHRRAELLSQHCALMRPPHAQEFASRLHLHVSREYVGQLMKSNYSCKNRKHEKAASKIRSQWERVSEHFQCMSTHEWLYDAGDDLSDVVAQKNAADIKDHLQPLVEHYPDFSQKHLVAVLNFRGLRRGREHQLILQRHAQLQEKTGAAGERSHAFFSNMPVAVQAGCLSNVPFSCLG
uniref:Exocyst complex component 3 n=1 Tax=Gasterosteus aculeatus aculeatus TaxID=481459 RepID=G3NLF7_GASAC